MANNFSTDTNCIALYRFESGALTVDARHDNTLTASGSPVANTSDYKEGAASVDLETSTSDFYYINDANLDPQFPLRNGDTNKKISIAGRFKLESLPATSAMRTLCSKYDGAANKRSFMVGAFYDGSVTRLRLYLGYNSGLSVETLIHGSNLSIATWYHATVTYDNTDKSYAIRLKDTNGNTIGTDLTGTATLDANKLSIVDVPFRIGSMNTAYTWGMDGLVDEVVVTNDILTSAEATQIAQGTYTGPVGGTTTISYTATGGFVIGGSASSSASTGTTHIATGGFVIGGSANVTRTRNYTGTGGMLIGGTALFSISYFGVATIKKILHAWSATGLTIYCIIRREVDNYRLNDAGGTFAASPADPYLSLVEDSVIKGLYEVEESRTAWDDGRSTVP